MSTIEEEEDGSFQSVDPDWFVSPVERITTSGGTAPFFKLQLTEKGLQAMQSKTSDMDQNYWIGKDLEHAQDEKDFYADILRIRSKQLANGIREADLDRGVGILDPFLLDYLGILKTKTADSESPCHLLVMANLRNNCRLFRMMDLKIGEKTACGGWKGKSHIRAVKHKFMDYWTNSILEGYRLVGFNGCPQVIDSMDPLLDILADDSVQSISTSGRRQSMVEQMYQRQSARLQQGPRRPNKQISFKQTLQTGHVKDYVKTMWGYKIKKSKIKEVEKHMFKRMNGTNAFRYFFDLHSHDHSAQSTDRFWPIEVAEITAHEFMTQLVQLSKLCHKVEIPQKWIGSSVAVAYDAGSFPERSEKAEEQVRSRVCCRIFDWGRSELLTEANYKQLSASKRADRKRYWNYYKQGIDRLSYNATRFYYNQFTNCTRWKEITIRVMDFSSLVGDTVIGRVVIPLPDVSDTLALIALGEVATYKILDGPAEEVGSTLECSLQYVEFPSTCSSRLKGAWRVTICKANNLPPMDMMQFLNTSNAYCTVTAQTATVGPIFHQQTCIRARTLNPEWSETIAVPICKQESMTPVLQANGVSLGDVADFLAWDQNEPNGKTMRSWVQALDGESITKGDDDDDESRS